MSCLFAYVFLQNVLSSGQKSKMQPTNYEGKWFFPQVSCARKIIKTEETHALFALFFLRRQGKNNCVFAVSGEPRWSTGRRQGYERKEWWKSLTLLPSLLGLPRLALLNVFCLCLLICHLAAFFVPAVSKYNFLINFLWPSHLTIILCGFFPARRLLYAYTPFHRAETELLGEVNKTDYIYWK